VIVSAPYYWDHVGSTEYLISWLSSLVLMMFFYSCHYFCFSIYSISVIDHCWYLCVMVDIWWRRVCWQCVMSTAGGFPFLELEFLLSHWCMGAEPLKLFFTDASIVRFWDRQVTKYFESVNACMLLVMCVLWVVRIANIWVQIHFHLTLILH